MSSRSIPHLFIPRLFIFVTFCLFSSASHAKDPLPSWNEGRTKAAIMQFVTAVSDEKNPGFVPVAERIAVFDVDGTLMNEKPIFMQANFLDFRVDDLGFKDKTFNDDPDVLRFNQRANWQEYFSSTPLESVMRVYALTHTGMSQDVFASIVEDYLEGNPQFARTVYVPMRELLDYLRANGFKPYLVTGSETGFIRRISEAYFGVPPEQVIGTSFKTNLEDKDGKLSILRLPEVGHYNDKQSKVLAIDLHIGRKPIFAAGNDGNAGDIYMLRYTTQAGGRSGFGLIVSHDDDRRAAAYTDKDGATMKAVEQHGWAKASVKEDWKTLFPSASNISNPAQMNRR